MRPFIAAILAIVAACLAAQAAAEPLTSYVNRRYSYAIRYPSSLLVALPEADNGDGRVFRARRGRTEARVWGGFNSLSVTPADIAEGLMANCIDRRTAYRVVRRGMMVVSCLTVEGVFYQKTLVRGERMVNLSMIYPIDERRLWDPVVETMAATMNLH